MLEESKNSIGGSFLYSFFITTISGIVIILYPLSIGLIFGPETMGNFSVLFSWSTFLSFPIANGISPAVARYIAANKKEDYVIYESIGSKLSVFYILIISIIFPILGFTIFDFQMVEFLLVLPLLYVTITHYLIRYILQGLEKFKKLLKLELIALGVFIPSMILFAILPNVLDWSGLTAFYYLLIPIILFHGTIVLIYIVPKFAKVKLKSFFIFPEITKKILLYALLIGLGSIFSFGTSQFQVIISDLYVSEFEVGVLSFWNSFVIPINLISITLGSILVPRITNLRKIDNKLSQQLVNLVNWSFSFIIVPIIGLLFLLISAYPGFLNVITFDKYDMEIYWLIVVLLIYRGTNYLLSSPTVAFYSSFERKVILNTINAFIFSIAAIISWIFLVPRVGVFGFAIGMAIGGLLSHIIVHVIALVITKGKIGFHFLFGLVAFGLNALGILFIDDVQPIWFLVPWSIVSIPVIICGIYSLIKILKDESYSQTKDDYLVEEPHINILN